MFYKDKHYYLYNTPEEVQFVEDMVATYSYYFSDCIGVVICNENGVKYAKMVFA